MQKREKDKVQIQRIDVSCKMVDLIINKIPYIVDFDILETDVVLVPESFDKVQLKSQRWWIANTIERKIRSSREFKKIFAK